MFCRVLTKLRWSAFMEMSRSTDKMVGGKKPPPIQSLGRVLRFFLPPSFSSSVSSPFLSFFFSFLCSIPPIYMMPGSVACGAWNWTDIQDTWLLPQPCCLPAVWPWESYSASLGFSVLLCWARSFWRRWPLVFFSGLKFLEAHPNKCLLKKFF